MPNVETRSGVLSGLAAAALFGASIPSSKALLSGLPPQSLAALLYLGSGIGLTLWIWRKRNPRSGEAAFDKSDVPFLAGSILFGGILAPLVLLIGLQRTNASTSSLLVNLEGVFTALLAALIFKENLGRRVLAGVMTIISAGVILTWSGTPDMSSLTGPALIGLACLCWGLDNNLSQRLSSKDPRRIAALKGLVGGATNGLVALGLGEPLGKWPLIPVALIIGFFSYGLSLVLYIGALRALGAARTGGYFSTAPFIGALLSVIFLNDGFTTQMASVGVLMAVGVWLLASETHEHLHVHPDETHEHRHVHDEHHQHQHNPEDPPGEPHSHRHRHERLEHRHRHYPDIHHRHNH